MFVQSAASMLIVILAEGAVSSVELQGSWQQLRLGSEVPVLSRERPDKKTWVQTIKAQKGLCTLDTKYYANGAIKYTWKREDCYWFNLMKTASYMAFI